MRAVTTTLAAAIEAPERTLRLTASIDWDGDGHNTEAIRPVAILDGYDRPPVVAGWGATPDGHAWLTSGTAADFSTTGTAGRITTTTLGATYLATVDTASTNHTIVVSETLPVLPTGASFTLRAVVRYTDASNFYNATVSVSTAGAATLSLTKNVAGAGSVINAGTSVGTHAAGNVWTIALDVSGTTVQARAWNASTGADPGVWQVTAVDASLLFGTRAGGGVRREAGNTNGVTNIGYDGVRIVAGNTDDISDRLADLTIDRALTGQLPDEVLVVEGIAAATATGDLVKGDTDDEALAAVQYFSRLNADSPLYGKKRANRDAQLAVEFLTSAGWESAPLLTRAVLRSLPVDVAARTARMKLIDARDRFRTPVALPAISAEEAFGGTSTSFPRSPGLESSWVVSYALWKCGLPLSPLPRPECRVWVPMHGSTAHFIGREFVGGPEYSYTVPDWNNVLGSANVPKRVEFGVGPFFLANALPAGDTAPQTVVRGFADDDGAAMFDSLGRSSGRIEFWARIPASPSNTDVAVEVRAQSYLAGTPFSTSDPVVQFGIQRNGVAFFHTDASVSGGVFRNVTGPTYTHDGAWHLYGVHWDDVAGSATFRRDTTSNVVAYAAVAAGDPPASNAVRYGIFAVVPAAEVQITTGIAVGTSWQPTTWASGVVVDRPQNRRLTGIYPADTPPQAWTLLQQVYGAERGLVWIDVDGTLNLWSAARLNTTDALTPVRTVTSTRDLLSLSYRDDRDMIRNIIRVPFAPLTVRPSAGLWSLTALVRIEPGAAFTTTVKLERPLVSAAALTGTAGTSATGGAGDFYAINSTSTGARPTVVVTSPTSVEVSVRNLLSVPLYLADTSGVPDLVLSGSTVSRETVDPVEVRSQASIDEFDPSPLDVPESPWSQTPAWALGVAWGLLALLKDEQLVFEGLEIPGDPRLEPLDRIRVQDTHGLHLDTSLTVQRRIDKFTAGGYTSALVARPSLDQWLLGVAGVGTPLGTTILGGTP